MSDDSESGKERSILTRRALVSSAVAYVPVGPGHLDKAAPRPARAMAKRIDDLLSIDPHLTNEGSGTELIGNLYETLIAVNSDTSGAFLPLLAKVPERLDGMRWTFRLETNRKFASGRPVTADDVVFSLERAIAADRTPRSYRPAAPTLRTLGLKVSPQGGAVVVEAGRPYAPGLVLAALASSAAAIVEKRVVLDSKAGWLDARSAGSGRFAIPDPLPKEPNPVTRDQQIILRPNLRHPLPPSTGPMTIFHVTDPAEQYMLLRQGKVAIARDLLPAALDEASQTQGFKVHRSPTSGLVYLAMNVSRDPFGDSAVREAVRWGVDYDRLVENGQFARLRIHQNFLPQGISGSSADLTYRFDPKRARSLLSKQPPSRQPVPIIIDHAGGGLRSSVAIAVADSLEDSGFRVTLRSQSGRELITRLRARDFQVALTDWGSDTMDPHSNAQAFCWNEDDSETSAVRTLAWICHWRDQSVNAAVDEAAVTQDPNDRITKYIALQRRVSADGPFAFLLQQYSVAAFRAPVGIELGFLSSQTRYAVTEPALARDRNWKERGRN